MGETGGVKRRGKMIFEFSEVAEFFRRSYEGTIVAEILSVMPCHRCGECCNLPVQVSYEDIDDISVFLERSFDEFMTEYLDRKSDGDYYLKTPCPFVEEGNTCRIHQVKPENVSCFPSI